MGSDRSGGGPERERPPGRLAPRAALRAKAAELMSRVIHTLPASVSVLQAQQRMERYGAEILPVVSRGRVVGAVSREVIEGAISHGLGRARVHDVASTEVMILPPEAPLAETRRVFLERSPAFVLVGRNRGSYDGIISRPALLRHLAEAGGRGEGERLRLDSLLDKRQRPRIREILHAARRVAEAADARPYLVGGIVRDLLLRRANSDVDLVVEADGVEFARQLRKVVGGEVREHARFGTAVLVLPDGFKVDIASSRTEFYPRPAALPEVRRGDLHHDLFRRDFTINALAIELHPKRYGRLVDLFGGHRDLQARTIRVLHSLSFIEDPTRALRAVRFANRLAFQISPETATYIRVAVRKKVFRHLSGERLLRELLFLLMEHRPMGSLRLLSQLGLLNAIHPALSLSARRLGLLERVERTLSWYDSLPARAEPLLRWQVYLLALIDGLDRRRLVSLLNRLAIRGRARAVFVEAGAAGRRLEQAFRRSPADRARIHSICSRHASEVLVFASARTQRRSVRGALGNYLTQLAGTRLEISGRDLKEMGLEPGPAFARILREVLRRKLRGEVSGREEELHLARQIAEGQG